jgi:hypothetical protein
MLVKYSDDRTARRRKVPGYWGHYGFWRYSYWRYGYWRYSYWRYSYWRYSYWR